ncbi:MAG: TlpA disulfide reductase family protein [Candidatus Sphingomonas colombiensis]|nr:TlpA disulfide reductase family protein [Sphingomonas sp.]WEK43097.1 MAG: TlpA disulfide reductase family protein [Sphingomonas sp.]
MDETIQLGFLALSVDRLIATIAIMVFVTVATLLADALRLRPARISRALVLGIVVSRLVYVLIHRAAYAAEPWSALALWQGGFTLWPGVIAAALVLGWRAAPWRKSAMLAAVPVVVALAWLGAQSLLATPPRPLPSGLQVETMDGKPMRLDELRGRPLVINLWASWCPPCRREMPMVIDVASRSSVPILLVNQGEDAGDIRRFLADHHLAHGAVLRDPAASIGAAIRSPALPATIFVDARGKVRERHIGEISRAALMTEIAKLEGKSS